MRSYNIYLWIISVSMIVSRFIHFMQMALFHFFLWLSNIPFRIPRPNLPVTPGVSWLSTFAFQSPMMKRTSFLGVSSKTSCRVFIEPFNFSFFSVTGWGIDLDYCDIEWFARTEIILSFLRLHPSTAFQTLLLTMMATPFLLRDSCPQ